MVGRALQTPSKNRPQPNVAGAAYLAGLDAYFSVSPARDVGQNGGAMASSIVSVRLVHVLFVLVEHNEQHRPACTARV
jgi:hypothetical protein